MCKEIIQRGVNTLDTFSHDAFITHQVIDFFSTVVKKCYLMDKPNSFFDELLSPFILMPLLEFSFEGGESTKQGAGFLKLMFNNLFLAEPNGAVIETMETNFGYDIFMGDEAEPSPDQDKGATPDLTV